MNYWILAGGNLGDTRTTIDLASQKIESYNTQIVFKSSYYESEPWGFESPNNFVNQLLIAESDLHPDDFMNMLLLIEKSLGRVRNSDGYAARTIDLDILFIDNLVYESNILKVPHPRMHIRKFALLPCIEFNSSFRHPVLLETLEELNYSCPDSSSVFKA